MPTDDVRRRWRNHRAELEAREERRYVDLAVAWERRATGETLGFFGGQWDRIEQRFTGREPARCALIRFNEGQLELARWAAWWAQERREGRPRPFFGLFAYGDRAGGKTFIAVAVVGSLLVEFPRFGAEGSVGFFVSRTHAERAEVDRYFGALFPSAWYRYRESPDHTYTWVTGATLINISADTPNTLKRGRVDFVLINEAALVGRAVPFKALPRIKDSGGLAVLTTNPPDSVKGEWVLKMHRRAAAARKAGREYPIKFLRIMSSDNDTIDHVVAEQVAEVLRDLDPHAAQADVAGLLLPVGEKAYYRFSEDLHVRPMPDTGDITREFTRQRLGRAYDYIGGVDFQGAPHHAAAICKVFGTIEAPVLWVCDHFVAEQSTEDDLLDLVGNAGYTPETLFWVGDASGQWQDGKHSRNGRDSFSVFRARRWRIDPPAEKRSDRGTYSKNPPVEKRVGLMNKMFGGPAAQDRADVFELQPAAPTCDTPVQLYVDPDRAQVIEALRECAWVKARYGGKPAGFFSHLTDALGYVCWWAYPMPRLPMPADDPVALSAPPLTYNFYG